MFLLLLGTIFMSINDGSIVGNSVLKILGALCLIAMIKLIPRSNNLL